METIQGGKVTLFESPIPMGVSVLTVFGGANELARETAVLPDGRLDLGPRQFQRVTGFRLLLSIPVEEPVVALHRNLKLLHGDYHNFSIVTLRGKEWAEPVTVDNIPVIRRRMHGEDQPATVWTSWKGPNRVDVWRVGQQVVLFQPGIVVRGDGETQYFQLVGDLRGVWNMFSRPNGEIDGEPDEPVWGAFSTRKAILNNSAFRALLKGVELMREEPPREVLNPPLGPITNPNRARMEWWSPFSGIRGQGPCSLQDGSPAWVCGEDVAANPDEDGIVRLPRNTLISCDGIKRNWGFDKQPSDQPKLLGVRRVAEEPV